MTGDDQHASWLLGNAINETGSPFDVQLHGLDERLEPPAAGEHQDPTRSELIDLPGEQSPSFVSLRCEDRPAGIAALGRCKLRQVRPGKAARPLRVVTRRWIHRSQDRTNVAPECRSRG